MAREPYHTVPVRRNTWERLKAYRMGGASYDDVLNDLMDRVSLEEYAARYLAKRRAPGDERAP
ncbi:MAG TPA: hypothetical protein VHH36_04200 [Candidatus Thermoplasmatota archaeon]|nr:hypothetical protein [Candidatus Thermoplasmatota archaeon]